MENINARFLLPNHIVFWFESLRVGKNQIKRMETPIVTTLITNVKNETRFLWNVWNRLNNKCKVLDIKWYGRKTVFENTKNNFYNIDRTLWKSKKRDSCAGFSKAIENINGIFSLSNHIVSAPDWFTRVFVFRDAKSGFHENR